jgi:hypothetical protein
MSEKISPISLRLPGELGRKFRDLQEQFDLPASVLLRLLVADQLSKDLTVQEEIVITQLRKGKHTKKPERHPRGGLNTQSHMS